MSATAKKAVRLSKVSRDFNLGVQTVVEFLAEKGHAVEASPNTKIPSELYTLLEKEFGQDKAEKQASRQVIQERQERESVSVASAPDPEEPVATEPPAAPPTAAPAAVEPAAPEKAKPAKPKAKKAPVADEAPTASEAPEPEAPAEGAEAKEGTQRVKGVTTVGRIDLDAHKKRAPAKKKAEEKKVEEKKAEEEPVAAAGKGKAEAPAPPAEQKDDQAAAEPEVIRVEVEKLAGPKTVGHIDLPPPRPARSRDRGRRKRIVKTGPVNVGKVVQQQQRRAATRGKDELDENAVKRKVSETLARLTGGGRKSRASRRRGSKRQERHQRREQENQAAQLAGQTIEVTEFVTAAELASLMDIPVTDVIKAYFDLGMMVSINQRLDAETLSVIADEYGFKVEFVGVEVQEDTLEEPDVAERLEHRAPIVTVMGHVDHGKTSLLDQIRNANVIAGEAGGITQHIGAYGVTLKNKKRITFLDTPGHEAFTAMRARGAQVTDIAIIVIAADDHVMPQTREAINHAQAAGVPMVFAINKIDKPQANPDKVREELSQMNILVEEWGGKYQSQEISAKKGTGIDELLEKVLLEAELLDLKADPGKRGTGVVIESSMEVGRGYVTTLLVEGGTLRKGDMVLVGQYSGHVRNMFNERGQSVEEAGPSVPVSILGIDGAPNAGDRFQVMEDEREARQIATRRQQLQREQGIRTRKHITLDEIGRRLAIGDFKELNIIVKGDVDGSVEALTDSLLKLSTENINVDVIHRAVGPIAESDVLLASASNAIIIGFQVRPTVGARKLAEQEEIEIRLYSIIYDAIEELRQAMEGMLAPKEEEKITGTAEVRETFRISKVGTVAGCYVLDGKISRNSRVRLIRDSIVVYTGEIKELKRFKDDVKEVTHGYECGMSIKNFNDIKVGDHIEAFEVVEVKRTLEG